MIEYFIYELKKDIATLIFTALLLIVLISTIPYDTQFSGLAIGSGLLVTAYMLFLVYRCINLLTDDLFSNKRLFVFSLPISKLNIVIGKYLYACVYIAVMLLSLILSAFITSFRLGQSMFGQNLTEGMFSTFTTCILIYSFIYLTMTIGKILFNSKNKSIILSAFFCVVGIIIEVNVVSEIFLRYADSIESFLRLLTVYISTFNLILSLIFTFISGFLLKKFLDV